MSRHFPAYDFDCDDMDPEFDAPEAPRSEPTMRRIRTRRTIGTALADEQKMVVACPFLDRWPSFDECLGCESFCGYAVDGRPAGSTVRCARVDAAARSTPGRADERGRSQRTTVDEVMKDPICVRKDVTIDELTSIFVNEKISGLPVVDGEGKLLGVVSKTDLVEAREGKLDRMPEPITAGELMTPHPHALAPTASIAEASSLMREHRVHRAPVVSRSGHVVGVLTALDIARWISTQE